MNLLEQHALNLMARDSLAEAEKIAARDVFPIGLAICLQQQLQADKEDVLGVLGDTHNGITALECDNLFVRNGFKVLYAETHGEAEDVFKIWGHADGLLLVTDTYAQRKMNTIQVYYNWRPKEKEMAYAIRSSGGFTQYGVWAGHYDGREGLFTHLKLLRSNGEFLQQWQEMPFLWLLNYTETRECGYSPQDLEFSAAVNKRKIALLPPASRGAMGA